MSEKADEISLIDLVKSQSRGDDLAGLLKESSILISA